MTEKKIIYVDTDTVKCSGENNDHPTVYYTIPKGGKAICGYCDIVYMYKQSYSEMMQDDLEPML